MGEAKSAANISRVRFEDDRISCSAVLGGCEAAVSAMMASCYGGEEFIEGMLSRGSCDQHASESRWVCVVVYVDTQSLPGRGLCIATTDGSFTSAPCLT